MLKMRINSVMPENNNYCKIRRTRTSVSSRIKTMGAVYSLYGQCIVWWFTDQLFLAKCRALVAGMLLLCVTKVSHDSSKKRVFLAGWRKAHNN